MAQIHYYLIDNQHGTLRAVNNHRTGLLNELFMIITKIYLPVELQRVSEILSECTD